MHTKLTLLRAVGALAAVALVAPTAASQSDFGLSFVRTADALQIHSRLTGAAGPGFLVLASIDSSFSAPVFLGVAPLDAAGAGTHVLQLPKTVTVPAGVTVALRALFLDGDVIVPSPSRKLALNPVPNERLSFGFAPGGATLLAGDILAAQYASAGLLIAADNKNAAHPDLAIVFDTDNPTGDDGDLGTPGPGAGNDTAFGKVLIVAEDDADADGDGRVDVPDDELFGGVVRFTFDAPVLLGEIALIDIDDPSPTELRTFNGGVPVQTIPVANLGDNSVQRIGFQLEAVTLLEVDLGGSGAIGELTFVPCPLRIGFDETTTGIPLAHQAGELVGEQFASLGMHVSARSNAVGGTDQAIFFDTANPTGDDADLATPGPGIGNNVALGKVLILAENLIDTDGDGLVDMPDDDGLGGDLVMDFDFDVIFTRATVIDVDTNETSFFELFDGNGMLLATLPLASLGDNSVQTIEASVAGVRQVVLRLGGSGALAELDFCPAADPVDA